MNFITALLIIMSPAVTTAGQQPREAPVWFWFSTCGGPLMTLDVQIDTRSIHKTTFPLCRANRDDVDGQGQAGRIEFVWRPDRAIVWTGYRERPERTAANEDIEVNIWQAGADPDVMFLGVSFETTKGILMNMVHLAHPSVADESVTAEGLVVRTYPAK